MKTSIPPYVLYITLIFCFVLSVIFQSCKEAPSVTYRIKNLDTTIEATKVPISKLTIDYKKYHGKYVETTGRFYFEFENVAIFKEKELFQDEQEGFWVSWLSELNLDDHELNKMNGKLVTVKGKIDTTEKGHMGQYFATIREIYFWK